MTWTEYELYTNCTNLQYLLIGIQTGNIPAADYDIEKLFESVLKLIQKTDLEAFTPAIKIRAESFISCLSKFKKNEKNKPTVVTVAIFFLDGLKTELIHRLGVKG